MQKDLETIIVASFLATFPGWITTRSSNGTHVDGNTFPVYSDTFGGYSKSPCIQMYCMIKRYDRFQAVPKEDIIPASEVVHRLITVKAFGW